MTRREIPHELIGLWLAGEAETPDREALLRQLAADPALADDLRRQHRLHLELSALLAAPEAALVAARARATALHDRPSVALRLAQSVRAPIRRFPRWMALAAILMVSLAVMLVFVARRDEGVRGSVAEGSLTWPDGSRITLEVGSLAAVRAPSGTERLHLESGSLHADIVPQRAGRPFVITTPHARTTVVGTSFRQSVAAEGTWLAVEHGLVELAGSSGQLQQVAAGQIASVAADGVATVWTRWADRRPIGVLTLSNEGARSAGNPGGWWQDATVDLRGVDGQRRFAERAERACDQAIARLSSLGAQGVVVWDIEGSSARAPIYPGDPRLLPRLAPEMDAVADRFFRRLTEAGFATGVRIGLHPLVASPDGVLRVQPDDAAMFDEAAARIATARDRWGCAMFFIGHGLTASGLAAMDAHRPIDTRRDLPPATLFARLRMRFPTCLILAEHVPADGGPAAIGLLPAEAQAQDDRLAEQARWPASDAAINLLGGQDRLQAMRLRGRVLPLVGLERPDLAELAAILRPTP